MRLIKAILFIISASTLTYAQGIYAADWRRIPQFKRGHEFVGRRHNVCHVLSETNAVSYGMYLWQAPLTLRRKLGAASIFPVNLIVLLLIAAIGYRFIEKPLQEFGRRLSKRWVGAGSTLSQQPTSHVV